MPKVQGRKLVVANLGSKAGREHSTWVAIARANSRRAARSSLREDDRPRLVGGWMSARKEDRQCGGGRGRGVVSRSPDRDHKLNCVKRRRAGHGLGPPPHRQQSTRCASLAISSNAPPLIQFVSQVSLVLNVILLAAHCHLSLQLALFPSTTVCLQAGPTHLSQFTPPFIK